MTTDARAGDPLADDPSADHRLRRAYDAGRAAALRGAEAAPGRTTTPEGRAFLRGYVDGAGERPARAAGP